MEILSTFFGGSPLTTLLKIGLVGIIAYILPTLYQILIYRRYLTPLRKIPGPVPPSIWNGVFPIVYKEQPTDPQLKWATQFGDIVYYPFIFNRGSVLITGPNELKHVLVTNEHNYQKDQGFEMFSKVIGRGLLLLEGEIHRQHRKMIQPAFNYSVIRGLVPVFQQKALALADRWREFAKNPSTYTEIASEMANLTLDVIGLSSFGYDFNAILNPKDGLQNEYKTIMGSFSLSLKNFIPGFRKLPLEENIRFRNAINRIKETIHTIIKTKRAGGQTTENDLLDILIKATDEDNGAVFTDEHLFAHSMIFLLAGHETTSNAMSWFFYSLHQNPRVEKKLLEELKEKLGDRDDFSADEVEKLPYLNNVINETLRLYPPAALTTRTAIKDDTLGGYHIPAGTRVVICPGVQHRLEKYWGKDALEFRPERWDEEQVKERSQYTFMPFLIGPRTCIGNRFAMLEMKVVLAILVRKFHLSLKPDTKVERKLTITMKPHPGLYMSISERN